MTKTYQFELPDDLATAFEIYQIRGQHRTRNAALIALLRKALKHPEATP